ncbi:hypothetical protein M0802_011733 [Mischocyttarus mexicanus]|nr:hypothetical protein M0802_011733 [Mischocyttarus mexicanus]
MCRSNFRIKLDLSRYYQDIRQTCWIFIDSTKISSISDIKKHINKLFDISEPYYLCLNNNEYLPPFEDARIIKENETIIVLPGNDLENQVKLSTNIVSRSFVQDNNISNKKENITSNHKEAETTECSVKKVTTTVPMKEESLRETSDFKYDLSSIDGTFHSIINDTEDNFSSDSKIMNNTITEDYSNNENEETFKGKRKRLRYRRRNRNKDKSICIIDKDDDEVETKKLKVTDSTVLSSGKHIRFNMNEINENLINQQSVAKEPPQLSKLFELRNTSTPIIFNNEKIKEEMKDISPVIISDTEKDNTNVSNEKENETLNNDFNNISNNNCITSQIISDIKAEQYIPVTLEDIDNFHIIGFKMFTVGQDYVRELSEMVVAQVLSCNKVSQSLTLKIIKGLDQFYGGNSPDEKSNTSEEETKKKSPIISNLSFSKMIDPCLIKNLY